MKYRVICKKGKWDDHVGGWEAGKIHKRTRYTSPGWLSHRKLKGCAKNGWGIAAQRAGDALGKLGRDRTSQSFGPTSTGHGESMRQCQQGWAPVWPPSGESGPIESSSAVFDLRWLRDEHTVWKLLRREGVEGHCPMPVWAFQTAKKQNSLH